MTNQKTIAEMTNEFLSEEIKNKRRAERHLEEALGLVQKQIENYEQLPYRDSSDEAFGYFERLEQLIQYVFEHVEECPSDYGSLINDEHAEVIEEVMAYIKLSNRRN